MTALTSMLRVPGYRQSLIDALTQDEETRSSIHTSLRRDVPRPAGVEDEDWLGIRTAVRLAYETASREGVDDTYDDIAKALKDDLTDDRAAVLRRWLAQDEQIDARISGTRQRDALQPNLVAVEGAVDLRILGREANGDLQVAPVTTIRILFDETVGGQESISLQVGGPEMLETIDLLQRLHAEAVATSKEDFRVAVPTWARVGTED